MNNTNKVYIDNEKTSFFKVTYRLLFTNYCDICTRARTHAHYTTSHHITCFSHYMVKLVRRSFRI